MSSRDIVLEGGSPWGFRIFGGSDVNLPLKVSRVNANGKAASKGIREGDIIRSINGQSVDALTYSEAHNLLKNSGATLRLGLNEGLEYTRERKRNKGIIHESHSETLKSLRKSSYTVKSSKTTFPATDEANATNGKGTEDKNHLKGHLEDDYPEPPISPISTVSSDVSSTSTLTERATLNSAIEANYAMEHSRTKRKRSRNQRRKNKSKAGTEIKSKDNETLDESNYIVDFPEQDKKLVKSRSFDDDTIVIQELNEPHDNDDNKILPLQTISLSSDSSDLEHLTLEEETTLRNYLSTLNLSYAPQEIVSVPQNQRAVIQQYFQPYNVRYLDVISEENSDLSDKEHLKQVTPEPPKKPPRKVKINLQKRNKKNSSIVEAKLVSTKILDVPSFTETVQGYIEKNEEPETVYIEEISSTDSSRSNSESEVVSDNKIEYNDLTPPPTPEENKIFKLDSNSSSSNSSRTTSPSTVRLNPFNNSVADVTSITEDLQAAQNASNFKQPFSLREICLNFLMTLPSGSEILQELSDISRNLEKLTHSTNAENLLAKCRQPALAVCNNSKLNISDQSEYLEANFKQTNTFEEKSRLEATNLSEWLKLARSEKSDDKTNNELNDVYLRQMQYILRKEKEIQLELERLEEEKRKLNMDFKPDEKMNYLPQVPNEKFRQKMYEEYMNKIAAMEDRKMHKIIKLRSVVEDKKQAFRPIDIQDEFLQKVRELHSGDVSDGSESSPCKSDDSVFLMDRSSPAEAHQLPKHLQEFVEITNELSKTFSDSDGIWAPGQKDDPNHGDYRYEEANRIENEPIASVWTPKSGASSPVVERKEFRPIKFESPILKRKNKSLEALQKQNSFESRPPWPNNQFKDSHSVPNFESSFRLPSSKSAPPGELHEFSTSRLPRAQNPTITLLQKAREGQLPKGASYIEPSNEYRIYPTGNPADFGYTRRNEYHSESENEGVSRMNQNKPRVLDGIGPVGRDGMPLSLRSEVRDSNQSKWYKKMYDTIHKQKPYKDEYVTVRYKQRRAQYPYISGYLSEPEPGSYDSDIEFKYATLDRRRTPMSEKENCYRTATMPRSVPLKTSSASDIIPGSKLNPGKIENYTPGNSSISDQESKRWWDEVMDVFDGNFEPEDRHYSPKGHLSRALKESGYESDSTLVFRRKEDPTLQLSPTEQKEAYKIIQKGGDIPLHGLRKAIPDKPKEPEPPVPPPKGHHSVTDFTTESPRKYVENQVTIHYKTPIRQEIKECYSEDELAQRQAETMKKIYQEERRRKYLQELQDLQNRRHTDYFIPSQKSPIPLNRYDDIDHFDGSAKPPPQSPEPRLVARSLYNFVGMSPRELTFRKGDLIHVRRQIDKNWYEGELNAMVGLFPANYVEIVPYEHVRTTPRKSHEGQARAKFNFQAKTHLELSLTKGETVIITRRVDDNWYEGKIGGRRGIFPVSYVDVLIDPQDSAKVSSKPVATPAAHSLLLNGKESMGTHSYTPNVQFQPSNPRSYFAKPVQVNEGQYGSMQRPAMKQTLHIDTPSEPIPYKALYKYLPQNDDELELMEGDKVYVLEKCDDGWFVGSNERTGAFGTFPGNYVEKA